MKVMIRLAGILLMVFPSNLFAFSLGDIAKQMRFGVDFITEGLLFVTLVTGSLLVLGSFFKYVKYRKNPIEVKFSSVMVMLVAGLALVLIYFLPRLHG